MRIMRNIILGIVVLATCGTMASCGNSEGDYTPKPPTFYRITMPEKGYATMDTAILPFTFEYPLYSTLNINATKKTSNGLTLYFHNSTALCLSATKASMVANAH